MYNTFIIQLPKDSFAHLRPRLFLNRTRWLRDLQPGTKSNQNLQDTNRKISKQEHTDSMTCLYKKENSKSI